jgi:hypothetical protein
MPNETKLWESFNDVLAHLPQWNQWSYIRGKYVPSANFAECGTTQCIAGFRCLRDGLIPKVDVFGEVTGRFVDQAGRIVHARDHGAREFELNIYEEVALLRYFTADPVDFKRRIEEIIDGQWAKPNGRPINPEREVCQMALIQREVAFPC